jgi:hypothetical protein
MGLAAAGLADDLGQLLMPSVVDGDFVPLPGLLLRLLAGPGEPNLDDLADVLGVVADAKVVADHLSDPRGGPQFGPPALGSGPLAKKLFESTKLHGVEVRRAAGMKLGVKLGGGFAVPPQSGVDGGPATAEKAGDHGGMLTLMDELNRTATPAFEFFCSSYGSHTTYYGTECALAQFPVLESVTSY